MYNVTVGIWTYFTNLCCSKVCLYQNIKDEEIINSNLVDELHCIFKGKLVLEIYLF